MRLKLISTAAAIASVSGATPSGVGNRLAPGPGDPGHLPDLAPGKPVLYAVSTGQVYHKTRAVAVYNTWCKTSESCIFYSDSDNPNSKPSTIKIQLEEIANKGIDGIHLAQLRYVRILRHAGNLVDTNRGGYFTANKFLIIADDDSYILHYNMLSYLSTLDASAPIYTGHTIDDGAYPVNGDGDGHTLNVSVTEHFACGGGGSVFSRAAVNQLNAHIDSCITDSMPGGTWWGWQSDWMFGACSARAGVRLINQDNNDRFGQFIYKPDDPGHTLALPDDPGVKQFCEHNGGWCKEAVSLHPLHATAGMYDIFKALPNSGNSSVHDLKFLLKADGRVAINGLDRK